MKLIALIFLSLFSFLLHSNISGQWKLPEENTVIEISQNGSIWEGVVISSDKKKAD